MPGWSAGACLLGKRLPALEDESALCAVQRPVRPLPPQNLNDDIPAGLMVLPCIRPGNCDLLGASRRQSTGRCRDRRRF